MIRLPGGFNSDLCDLHAKMTRRDLLRLGGSSILGLSLGQMLKLNASAATPSVALAGARPSMSHDLPSGRPESHLDLWDPKENVPDKVRSAFKTSRRRCPASTSPRSSRSSRR
jgi:hypothetical protein